MSSETQNQEINHTHDHSHDQDAELGVEAPMEIESFCTNCGYEKGITRLLLTRIPHFKEIILVSFQCPECHWKNVDIQFGGVFGERGINIVLNVENKKDLDRQVVKSDYCTVKIPEIELEIPAQTQKGVLSTVEGILSRTTTSLKEQQPYRKYTQPELYEAIENIIEKIDNYLEGNDKFTFELDDPSGNSYVENFHLPKEDPQIKTTYYERTIEQNHSIGLGILDDEQEKKLQEQRELRRRIEEHKNKTSQVVTSLLQGDEAEKFNLKHVTSSEDVAIMYAPCANCGVEGEIRNLLCNIPHFGEVLIISFVCEHCGYKTNDVKPGGGIKEKGCRITLKVTNPDDLNRDVLKSDSCSILIPEIPIEVTEGTLGGKFTTIEGLISAIEDQFLRMGSFSMGDSEYSEDRKLNLVDIIKKLQNLRTGEEPFTFIIDDPLSCSYIQNIYAPDPDPNMIIEIYERSEEQNEDLGISTMQV